MTKPKEDRNEKSKLLQPNEMVEGVHFYYDKGYIVFTELYHRMRGYCCGNGCKHCAYKVKS